jgi:hypothetical protein
MAYPSDRNNVIRTTASRRGLKTFAIAISPGWEMSVQVQRVIAWRWRGRRR